MNLNPSQSQRLPSFRDYNDIQKVVLPFSKNKILNKKTYVPNLDVSRKLPSSSAKVKTEETSVENSCKADGPKQRRNERKHNVVQTDGIFSSGIDKSSPHFQSKFGGKCSTAGSGGVKNKQLKRIIEKVDGQRKNDIEINSFKDVFEKRPESLENFSMSAHDLPSALPSSRTKKYEVGNHSHKEDIKMNSLLTDVLKPDDEDSPLFILKTPKYIPAMLDDSQNPKMNIKRNDVDANGYKCTIHDLPEGQIGKLQIMKSGKLRLVLGECKFILQRGVKVNFREELAIINVNANDKNGEIVNLGNITDRIIVVPENVTDLIKAA